MTHAQLTQAFTDIYLGGIQESDLVARGGNEWRTVVETHLRAGRSRPAAEPIIQLSDAGYRHVVAIDIVTDDMPYLVDSVFAALTGAGCRIELAVHPRLRAERDASGELLAVDRPGAGGATESWMHFEVDVGDADLDELATALASVLADVRACYRDAGAMRAQMIALADAIAAVPARAESAALLRWLTEDHLVFLGYRRYTRAERAGRPVLVVDAASGLGISRRSDGRARAQRTIEPATEQLVVTKANSRSTVHRPAHMDYIAVQEVDSAGSVLAEHRFLGLFTTAAYRCAASDVPIVRRTVAGAAERAGHSPQSHSGRALMELVETFPRDELFEMSASELADVVMGVSGLSERRRTRAFWRVDRYRRFVSVLVYLPRDRYTTAVRETMQALLADALGATDVEYSAHVGESVLARLHFTAWVGRGRLIDELDVGQLDRQFASAARTWSDDLIVAAQQRWKGEREDLVARYAGAFPDSYKEDFVPEQGLADAEILDSLPEPDQAKGTSLTCRLYPDLAGDPQQCRLKIYAVGERLSLAQLAPMLSQLGAEVLEERPYGIEVPDGFAAWIYDFGLRMRAVAGDPVAALADPAVQSRFEQAFEAVWSARADADELGALVLAAGLNWRQVAIVRMYVRYLRQAGVAFSLPYMARVLVAHPAITGGLVHLFETRFDPGRAEREREPAQIDRLVGQLRGQIDQVATLDADRILRTILAAIGVTVRTNAYQQASLERGHLAIKLAPSDLDVLPQPRPKHEIWVCAPQVEGVHLRFDAVARGGLRWSDRREDLRTEILGLVAAQQVKNAVIVPSGAKGGFVVRHPVAGTDRAAVRAQGVECYSTFIRGMLDITDNRRGGQVVPPEQTIRYDGDDPYLVVAADKGTASFSDIANAIAEEYGFWLGDAFASGGSRGYDHKALGITARGAWESVKRHFQELGRDVQSQRTTVVGIGDMSGDVFGNAMLLSDHLALVAAFDHRHIFVDPNPNLEESWRERRRLFDLPASSWADYDSALISPGGGIFPRSAKSIPISPEVARCLGLAEPASAVQPTELIRLILQAPVDLLFNGGIGTYVKASTETDGQVGDKANDAVRIDGRQVRATVIGEGGNLGMTQRGRIEAALHGRHVNTDAVDNSAGVDTSDHEVNIKILLAGAIESGELAAQERDGLLANSAEQVCDLVLRDNVEQNVLLSNTRAEATSMAPAHRRYLRHLQASAGLDRQVDALPSDEELAERIADGGALTSPELSVLMARAKLTAKAELLASDVPDEPWGNDALRAYFPLSLLGVSAGQLEHHPLRREIIATSLVNEMVNVAGLTYAFRAMEETGADLPAVARAYRAASDIFGVPDKVAAIRAAESQVAPEVPIALHGELRRLIDRTARRVLLTGGAVDVLALRTRYRPLRDLEAKVPGWLRGGEAHALQGVVDRFVDLGAPVELATRVGGVMFGFGLLEVLDLHRATGTDAREVGQVFYAVSDFLGIDDVLEAITALDRGERAMAQARTSLRDDVYRAWSGITGTILRSQPRSPEPDLADLPDLAAGRIATWRAVNGPALRMAQTTLAEVRPRRASSLAALMVAVRALRTLASR